MDHGTDDRILTPAEVRRLTSLSEATIWRLRKRDQFPKEVRLSPQRIGWRRSDIERYVARGMQPAAA